MLNLVHEDDRTTLQQAMIASQNEHMPVLNVNFGVQHPTQGWRWMLLSGQIVTLNMQQQAERVIGTLQDITRRKAAELLAIEAAKEAREANEAKKRLPRQYEPRNPHPDERHSRHDAALPRYAADRGAAGVPFAGDELSPVAAAHY